MEYHCLQVWSHSLCFWYLIWIHLARGYGRGPVFDLPSLNVTVLQGQTAVLPCSIHRLGKFKVSWTDMFGSALTDGDTRIVDDVRVGVVIRSDTKEWNLEIRDVRYEDEGEYRCTINSVPAKSKTVILHVKVLTHIIPELSSSDVSVREGDDVRLVCKVTGVPQPNVMWYYHNDTFKRTNKQRLSQSGEVLYLYDVTRSAAGVYTCVGDNGVPPAVARQIKVKVKGALPHPTHSLGVPAVCSRSAVILSVVLSGIIHQ